MYIKLFLASIVLLLYYTAYSQESSVSAISAEKFERKIKKKNAVVLDVRTSAEYQEGYIPAGINYNVLDSLQFVQSVRSLDRKKKYFLYCKSGRRSGKALLIMQELGFTQVRHLAGGITAWTGEKTIPEK